MTDTTAGPATTQVPAVPGDLIYLTKQVEQASRLHLDAILKPFGITAVQYWPLALLARDPSLSSADIARSAFVRAQTVAETVATLERLGYLSRADDPQNRRRSVLSLTLAGERLQRDVAPAIATLEMTMLQNLSESAATTLHDSLESCRQVLRAYPVQASADSVAHLVP